MKVLAINGSPRRDGNTFFSLNIIATELLLEGIDTEILQIGDDLIQGCMACGACGNMKNEQCIIQDDLVNDTIQKMKVADGLIFGSPVHFAGMSSNLKAFMDRAFYVSSKNDNLFRHKVATSVVAARRSGGVTTFDSISNYLLYAEMIVATGNYWNVIHGRDINEAQKDEEGVQTLKVLAKNMAWILKLIKNGEGTITPPAREIKISTNFIR